MSFDFLTVIIKTLFILDYAGISGIYEYIYVLPVSFS